MTIQLTTNSINTFALTLTELANPDVEQNWLLRFNKDQGEREYLLFVDDISVAPERYNEFVLSEGEETGDDISFIDLGDYKYEAYQMPDTNDTDYTRGTLVEIGKMRLTEQQEDRSAYQTTINKNVYNPE